MILTHLSLLYKAIRPIPISNGMVFLQWQRVGRCIGMPPMRDQAVLKPPNHFGGMIG
jgi:hypothetical protein